MALGRLSLVPLVIILSLGMACAEGAPDDRHAEPGPPAIPQPRPEPKPIPVPTPEPIQDPFPEESDAEKIQRLTQENDDLVSRNIELESENDVLKQEIIKLRQIVNEQLNVILYLLDQIKQTVFST